MPRGPWSCWAITRRSRTGGAFDLVASQRDRPGPLQQTEWRSITEAAVERLYKIFTRRARRKSRGLQSPRVEVATEISRTAFKEPSSAELAEERAQWILKRCGQEFAMSLVAMRDRGGLDDAVRVLKTKLVALNLPVRRRSNGRSW